MGDPSIEVAATCVRVPVLRCHGEAINVEFAGEVTAVSYTHLDVYKRQVLKWSRLYAFMESCCDACEHTADLMSTILLKNM